ncbi:hypothetical protein HHK36_012577 [Tetracentron sinense]|uniref:EID1-like F-box protein 3 n=1 Tax=Tetracentron sinense TaxID=13715 RepID=A0A834ZD77_TETSI|nr:hypothetical protein HHK36_012577 [Tetracentron sinense]
MNANQRRRPNPLGDEPDHESEDSGILNERVLMLVFESINWDLQVLCLTASVSRKLCAVAKRLLWRELCVSRAPRMAATLVNGAPKGRVGGGWHALAKLLFFCCGCESSRHFRVNGSSPGHFVKASRFSKTSGRSFLAKNCEGDLLYVSDPCEHSMGEKDNADDLGVYRGVFRGFPMSKTRAYLVRRQVELEDRVRCPYCGAPVWSMTRAGLVPRSAARRLGSHEGSLEYFVCVSGHLHGACWLAPLSSDEENGYDDDDGGVHGFDGGYDTVESRDKSSSGEEVGDGPAV